MNEERTSIDRPVEVNPYASPSEPGREPSKVPVATGRSSGGRFLAAQIDHGFGVVLFLAVGMNFADTLGDIPTGILALLVYLGYYAVPEWLFGATLGKSLFSLRVRQLSGSPCTARQIVVRTLMRLVEVNPLFLGALPAGIAIMATSRKQRLGDLLAGTVVVHRNDLPGADRPKPAIRVVRRART